MRQRHGRDFLARLRAYDARLQPLIAALNRQHVPLRKSARYRALAQDVRGYVTNEVNRCLNRILDPGKGGDPATARVIVEKLDFRGLAKAGRLSRRLRRILATAGRAVVSRKLRSLREDYGIETVEVNASYSSQECDGCGYVAKSTPGPGRCSSAGCAGRPSTPTSAGPGRWWNVPSQAGSPGPDRGQGNGPPSAA